MSNTVKLNTCPKCNAPIPAEAPQGLCPKCVLLGAATATEQGVPATATSEIPSIERIAAAFPQLQVLELIGRGGMGFVFKARQPHLDRFVALKLLPDKLAKDAQFAERFNREGRVLAKLNHPNIVSVFDFGQTGGFYYLLMEYVDGVNLRQAMRAGRFSPSEALSIVPKVCEALQYAHEQGVLHRDIKPENILLDAKGRVKIADFGIAKLVGEDQPSVTLTNTGAALGTPHYMAPEQLEKPSTVDHRADIYSLGVVFYEMLTGELPIGRFAPPSSKTPVGASVDEVVFRTLEKDRERRFQSAGEMKTQVEGLTGVEAIQPRGTTDTGLPAAHSQAAIWGAVLTGLSLPVPLTMLVAGGIGPAELWLLLGSVGLFGVVGTILGWVALSDIRASQGRLRGLPLAAFAGLTWPLLVLAGITLGIPYLALGGDRGAGAARPLLGWLLLLVPAGTITFALWAVHATTRWASGQPPTRQRGVLKWVFLGLMAAALGLVLLPNILPRHQTVAPAPSQMDVESATVNEAPEQAAPMIQFTFTSVELRDEEGAPWLAMDYVEQVRGDCQHTFRYEAYDVPGFRARTRAEAFMSDAKAGFPPVLHQRILWKLPPSLPPAEAQALRDLVAKEWVGKSAAIQPNDDRVLFKVVVPGGGSLVSAVGVVPRKAASGTAKESAPGVVKLVGATDHQNLVFARLESVPRHPLHQIVARFAGPEIPEQASRARSAIQGPLLVPSPDEDMNTSAEPVDGSNLWGTNQPPVTSAISFECPGDYSLQFVLPDETLARDAAQQIRNALAQRLSPFSDRLIPLVPGRPIQLFTTGNWKGWLETRPFKPEPNRLAFFRHPGRSPAQIPGTNAIESAVATVPPGHELKVTGRLVVNGVNRPEPVFSTTLTSGPNEPGIYWFTWYLTPNPQRMDMAPKEKWELQIHDVVGRELLRSQAPERLNILWKKRWVGDEPIRVRAGKEVREIFFEKANIAADRGPTMLLLEMTMQRSVPVPPDR